VCSQDFHIHFFALNLAVNSFTPRRWQCDAPGLEVGRGAQVRARLKPTAEWERHKEDIISACLFSSLDGVVECMSQNHDFGAS
jgi:hypothetical protein